MIDVRRRLIGERRGRRRSAIWCTARRENRARDHDHQWDFGHLRTPRGNCLDAIKLGPRGYQTVTRGDRAHGAVCGRRRSGSRKRLSQRLYEIGDGSRF